MSQPDKRVYDFTGHGRLNLHLLSAHANGAALGLTPAEAEDAHHREHFGPGGIRNHPYSNWSFDPVKASRTIDEAAQMNGDDHDKEVAALLARPDQQFTLPLGSHTHDPIGADHPNPAACTHRPCEVFPRAIEVTVTRDADGAYKSSQSTTVTSLGDLAHATLSLIRKQIGFADALVDDRPRQAAAYVHDTYQRIVAFGAILLPLADPDQYRLDEHPLRADLDTQESPHA